MDAFAIELAGLRVGVEARFGYTRGKCAGFEAADAEGQNRPACAGRQRGAEGCARPSESQTACKDPAGKAALPAQSGRDPLVGCDFAVAASEEDLEREQEENERANSTPGRKAARLSDGYAEFIALHRKISDAMLRREILLFHGSTVEVDGRAYLFTAPSGTGKSTHARLWGEVLGERMAYVNDDKPFLRFEGTSGPIIACGSPWMGKHGLGSSACAPLAAVVRIVQAPHDRIERLSPEDAFEPLFAQAHRPKSPEGLAASMRLVAALCENVPAYRLECTPTLEAARLCQRAVIR